GARRSYLGRTASPHSPRVQRRTIATLERRIVGSQSTRPPGGRMIDVKTADRELQLYVRPQTFPVAIRMLRPGEDIPDRARRPARDFKKLSMNCQVIDMARRYGWMIALTRDDSICSLGIAALGLRKPPPRSTSAPLAGGMDREP